MRRGMLTTAFLAGTLLIAGAVAASQGGDSGGSGGYGESYSGDLQRNPRLIEPGAERDRYLAYYGREGWYDRQAAAGRAGPYGTVTVRPYR